MLPQIVIEEETPGDSWTMFRLRIDAYVIAERLTSVQARLRVAEIFEWTAAAEIGKASPLSSLDGHDGGFVDDRPTLTGQASRPLDQQ